MLFDGYEAVLKEEMKMSDIIVGFNDTEEYPDSGIVPAVTAPTENRFKQGYG